MNIFVSNLAYQVTEDELRTAFGAFGQVDTVNIISDKYSGVSKGFGFVEMPNQTEAQAAIAALNGKELKGRNLTVNVARPKGEGGGGRSFDKRPGGGGGNRPGGGGNRPGGGGGKRW